MKRLYLTIIFILCIFIFENRLLLNQVSAAGVAGCNDQSIGDLSDPGNPVGSTQYDLYHDDPNYLAYDHVNFDVFQRQMHNRLVTVAIHKDYDLAYDDRLEYSEFVFNTWAIFWKEFGGFPFPSYTVLVGNDLPYSEVSAFGEGYVSPYTRTDVISHEIYHAWNGNAFSQNNGRTWLMEGVTMYYGNLRQQQTGYSFEALIKSFYDSPYGEGSYLSYYSSGQDRPLADTSQNNSDYNHHFVAMKGSLVAYMLDKKLSETGHHIGEVMKLIYQRYGTESKGYLTNEQILYIFNEVSGEDYTDFFNRYIYGTEKLPLEGESWEWICHKDRSSINAFVTRFYQQCLSREPDSSGLNGWTNALLNGSLKGSDVATSFIFSQEFINRYTTNEDFVTILYRAFFNREPDGAGYSGWLNALYDGTSRSDVLDGFTGSQEFINLCGNYGITPN